MKVSAQMVQETYVRQHSLDPRQAAPVNVVRGPVNDLFDAMGLPRPDEVIPAPADVVRSLGLPTIEQAVPTPKEVGEKIFSGRLPGAPPRPPTPREFFREGY